MGLARFEAVLFLIAVGCTVDAVGSGPDRPRCAGDADCPAPQNPCEVGVCRSNFCYVEQATDGPLLSQVPGDCTFSICQAGVLVNERDDTDSVDADPCTIDACTDAGPTHQPAPEMTPCLLPGQNGSCIGGICVVECTMDSQCPTADCQAPKCDGNKCKTVIDDTNVPDDGLPCTFETCTAGVLSTGDVPAGPAAGCPTECDGMGACYECLDDAHCAMGSHCESNVCFSCTNLMVDPGETGVDCGDPVCGDCPGTACTMGPNTCASGFCVDGVCCDEAMCGECETCAPAGSCVPVADGIMDDSCTAPDVCILGDCTRPLPT